MCQCSKQANGQGGNYLNTGLRQGCTPDGTKKAAATCMIDQEFYIDAAHTGCDQFASKFIHQSARVPNVGFQNHTVLGVADILDQPFEYMLRGTQYLQPFIIECADTYLGGHQPIDCEAQLAARKGVAIVLKLGGEIGQIRLDHCVGARGALTPQVQLADQQIQRRSQNREDINDEQPSESHAYRSTQRNDTDGD